MTKLSEMFAALSGAVQILENEPMSAHTSFKTGGCAELLLLPQTEAAFIEAMRIIRQSALDYKIIGRGSNLLVSDAGISGVTLKICFGDTIIEKNILTAGAGVSLKQVALAAAHASLGGLEFAAGIPGSLGGGVVMNAGAYGGELGEYIRSVRILDTNGNIREINAVDMDFGYRHSAVMDNGWTVLSAKFSLVEGNMSQILSEIEGLAARRREKQPLEFPSAGSTFKRPEGHFAGALIEQCGLKGECFGGAQVSPKHAGFIINTGGATSSDIHSLMKRVTKKVLAETGVLLSPEVQLLGEFDD